MVAMADIQGVADQIVERFNPERIILFGSQARGTAGQYSDVDLLVILPFEGRPMDKSLEILRTIGQRSFALDLLARQPDDTARRYVEYDPLIRDAIDKVLYDANASRVDR